MVTETRFGLVRSVASILVAVLTVAGCAVDDQKMTESAAVTLADTTRSTTSVAPTLMPDTDTTPTNVGSETVATDTSTTVDTASGNVTVTDVEVGPTDIVESSPSTPTVPPPTVAPLTTTVTPPTTTIPPTSTVTTTTIVEPPPTTTVLPTQGSTPERSRPAPNPEPIISTTPQAGWFTPMYRVEGSPNPAVAVLSVTHNPAVCVNNTPVFSWVLSLSDGTTVTRQWSPPFWALPAADVYGQEPYLGEHWYWDSDPIYGTHSVQVAFSLRFNPHECDPDRRLLGSYAEEPGFIGSRMHPIGYYNHALDSLTYWVLGSPEYTVPEKTQLFRELAYMLGALTMVEQRTLYENMLQYPGPNRSEPFGHDQESLRGRRLVEWLLETQPRWMCPASRAQPCYRV